MGLPPDLFHQRRRSSTLTPVAADRWLRVSIGNRNMDKQNPAATTQATTSAIKVAVSVADISHIGSDAFSRQPRPLNGASLRNATRKNADPNILKGCRRAVPPPANFCQRTPTPDISSLGRVSALRVWRTPGADITSSPRHDACHQRWVSAFEGQGRQTLL